MGGGGGIGGGGYHGLDWEDFGVSEDVAPFLDLLPVQDEGDLHITVGGDGGASGRGGDVTVTNTGTIVTRGDGSMGVLAQSIGGGGGIGGSGAVGDADGSTVTLGGAGGASGDGGRIGLDLRGDILTYGVAAHGVYAQSVGGGGGYAGNADKGLTSFGINLAIAGDGGSGGDGGDIDIVSAGNITTHGDGAVGIFAQSVGGGGGVGGSVGEGFGFAGSVGDVGDGGDVDVVHTGNITTTGAYSHGIVAQSVGGADYGGDVRVRILGDITVLGEGALGVIAQSEGAAGKRSVDIVYEGGTITGHTGAAVSLLDGLANTFTNRGTVTTTGAVDGLAFAATTGADAIDNYGRVIGRVDLGAGANAFRNRPGGLFEAGATIRLGAANTLTNAGTLSPGGAGNPLTTTLDGNLAQTASGLFTADVFSTGACDRLVVAGDSASLDGALEVLRAPGYYRDGARYTVLEATGAGGLSGAFSALRLPEDLPLLRFDINQLPGLVEVLVASPAIASVAANPVQMALAAYLDRIAPTASGDLLDVLGEFQALTLGELGEAFATLSPDSYAGATGASFDLSRQFSQLLEQRLALMRSGGYAQAPAPTPPILLASAGSDDDLGRYLASPRQAQVQGGSGLWINGFGQWGAQGGDDGYTGYAHTTQAGALGFDRALADGLIVGLSAGVAGTQIDLDHDRGDGRIDSTSGAVYGSYFTQRFYADASLAYGRNRYKNHRRITIGADQRYASSDHDGDVFSAFLGGGYTFDVGRWRLGPFGSLQYTYLDEEGFTESGAESVNLRVDGRDTDALVSELGLRVFREWQVPNGSLIPEVSAAWSYDFDLDERVIRASFTGAPGTSFAVAGQDVEPHGAVLGAGLTYARQGGFAASLKYRGEVRPAYESHGIIGEIRFAF